MIPAIGSIVTFGYRQPSGGTVPVVSAVSPNVVDTAGGGGFVVVTVDSSTGCTGISAGGVAFTSFSIVDATHVKGIPGAHAAGAVAVVVTNATGPSTTGGTPLEYWNPGSATGVTLFVERPNYAVAAGTGTWTARVGANVSKNPAPADDGTGEPTFTTGSVYLDAASLNTFISSTSGTCAAVVQPTRAAAAYAGGTPYNCPNVFSNAGNGTAGMWFANIGGVDKAGAHIYDGASYVEVSTPCSQNTYHSLLMRFDSTLLTLEVGVDGLTPASTPITGAWGITAGAMQIGANYNQAAANDFLGTIRALVFSTSRLDNTFWSKFHTWAQQRHGAP